MEFSRALCEVTRIVIYDVTWLCMCFWPEWGRGCVSDPGRLSHCLSLEKARLEAWFKALAKGILAGGNTASILLRGVCPSLKAETKKSRNVTVKGDTLSLLLLKTVHSKNRIITEQIPFLCTQIDRKQMLKYTNVQSTLFIETKMGGGQLNCSP